MKYGDTYHIHLRNITLPMTLEFRYGITHINQTTESPPVVLLNQTSIPVDEYKGRLTIRAKEVTLHKVTGMDEGSYTILDRDGKIRMRTCLNVKGEGDGWQRGGDSLKWSLQRRHFKTKPFRGDS